MSESMIVFIRSNKVPGINEMRKSLGSRGLILESWDEVVQLTEVEGFWPGSYKGAEAGFEFMLEQIDDEDLENWDIERSDLHGRDYVLELSYYNEQDLAASAICAAYFIECCDGLTFDDNEELSINSGNVEEWVKFYL